MSRTSSALLVGAGAVTASAALTVAFALGAATSASPAGSDQSIVLAEAAASTPAVSIQGDQGHPAQLKLITKRTERQVLALGDDGVSSGSLSFAEGEIRSKRRGEVIGRFVFRGLALDSDEPGGLEDRDITVEYTLPDGIILVSGIVSAPGGLPPSNAQDQVIVGGTGRYAGAGGSVRYVPINNNEQRVIFTFAW